MSIVTPYNFSILLFAFCSFMLGLMVWFKRQDNVGNVYFVYSFFVTLWGIAFAITMNEAISPKAALFYARLLNASALMIGPTWYHFCFLYTNQSKTALSKKIIKTAYAFAVTVEFFTWTSWFVPSVRSIAGFKYWATAGSLFYVFTLLFFICVFGGFFHLFQYLKNSPSTDKRQTQILILAKSIGFIGGGLTFLPVYGIAFPQFGIFLMPLYPFVTAYLISAQKLFDIEELAEAAHRNKLETIGILSASINHELRNPLYIIKNYAESLLINSREGVYKDFESLRSKLSEILERIVSQSDKTMKIIGRLTAFARKKPDQDFKMAPVALPALIADLDILIRCEIETHKIEIVQEIPENLPLVFADPAHLEEILLNLILNAYQVLKGYQTENIKKIMISAVSLPVIPDNDPGSSSGFRVKARNDMKNNKIQITIKDNGPGISPEDLPNIFKPFYTKKKEGLGLGLYITKQLVEKNRGTISIESKPGHGASFILEFNQS